MMFKFFQKRRGKEVWTVAKEAATRFLGTYISRRRSTVRYARKLSWRMLWFRVRRSVGLVRDRQVVTGYTVVSYARNFDDGSWKEEEVEYLRSRSFVYRFGGSSRVASWWWSCLYIFFSSLILLLTTIIVSYVGNFVLLRWKYVSACN